MRSFSSAWKASKKPSKQRKYRYGAPLHVRRRFLAVHLSNDLKQKHGMRNLVVRMGDKVKVIKGDYKGKEGKVSMVSLKKTLVYVEGIERQRRDGSKSQLGIAPANMIIIELNTEDKRRMPETQNNDKSAKAEKKPSKETKK
jgi:large subunit ribosomal protein L24